MCLKKFLLSFLALFAVAFPLCAQNEEPRDSVFTLTNVKSYDGFLLDLGLMNLQPPTLPRFTLNDVLDYKAAPSYKFDLPPVTYGSSVWSSNPFGLSNFWSTPETLQTATFKLNNGMSIRTMGQYNSEGWRVPNPSALPWERNNFKGAFELKSANGAFGIRIEVERGRHTPY